MIVHLLMIEVKVFAIPASVPPDSFTSSPAA